MRTAVARAAEVILVAVVNGGRVEAERIRPRGLIYKDPAPPPDKGPPLSAGASRDPALIPIQVGAIVASYVLTVFIIGTALFFVGRRLRRKAETSTKTLDLQMVKPITNLSAHTTPVSPKSNRLDQLPSPRSVGKGAPNFSYPSPSKQSIVTFDDRVLEEDKNQRERDMERLYAAVMSHDAANSPKKSPSVDSEAPLSPLRSQPPPQYSASNRSTTMSQTSEPWERRGSEATSRASLVSKRRGIRGMQISSPVPTPAASVHSRTNSRDEPLTPSMPPPPPPPQPLGIQQIRIPPQQPSASGVGLSPTAAIRPTISTSLAAAPSYPSPREYSSRSPGSSVSTAKPLPLRDMNAREAPRSSPLSPGPTKLTVLERKPGPSHAGPPRTGATPMSASVPYSPYMPFTPVTPITPRLVTRGDRKRREKEEGREVITEMVEDEKGMWDEGY